MSRTLQIKTPMLNLDFNLNSTLVFIGGNVSYKREILNAFLQSATKYSDDINRDLFPSANKVIFEGAEVTNRNTDIIYLDQYYSLYKELVLKKSYYFYEELLEVSNRIDIVDRVERINDEMSLFEFQMNEALKEDYPELAISLSYISQETLIKKFTSLDLNSDISNPRNTIETFVNLISRVIQRSGIRIWIVLDGINRHLEIKDYLFLYESLEKIAVETQRLNLFLFNVDDALEHLDIVTEDCIVIYDEVQQFLPIGEVKQSIERHYPDDFQMEENVLKQRVLSLLPYIGYQGKVSIDSKNMIILVVLKELLGDRRKIETSIEPLSNLEKLFLEDHIK